MRPCSDLSRMLALLRTDTAGSCLDPVTLHAPVQGLPRQSQRLRSATDHPGMLIKGILDRIAAGFIQIAPGRRRLRRIGEIQVLRCDRFPLDQQAGAVDGVLQLAHVARPAVRDQRLARFPDSRARPSRKNSASGRMSSLRSASGGRFTSITLRR